MLCSMDGQVSQSLFLSLCLCDCLSLSLCMCLCVHVFVCLSSCLSVSLFVYVCVFVCLSSCLSVCLSFFHCCTHWPSIMMMAPFFLSRMSLTTAWWWRVPGQKGRQAITWNRMLAHLVQLQNLLVACIHTEACTHIHIHTCTHTYTQKYAHTHTLTYLYAGLSPTIPHNEHSYKPDVGKVFFSSTYCSPCRTCWNVYKVANVYNHTRIRLLFNKFLLVQLHRFSQ